jgi:SAM-dependent methyltransferase
LGGHSAGEDVALEAIECIFCQNSTSSVVIQESGFDARQCANCGLIFVSPRPSAEEIADLYVSDKAHLSAQSHLRSSESRVNRAATEYRLSVLRGYIKSGSTIAEIGAGGGYFLDEARKHGFDVQAVEINPVQAEFIRTELGIPCAASLGELREATGRDSHDVVYLRDVVSHFSDPIAEFAAINEALVPGGVVAFETGNLADVDHRYFKYFPLFQFPDHLFFFGDASLESLLTMTGFELVAIRRWSILPQLRLVYQLRRLRGGTGNVERANVTGEQRSEPDAKRSSLREAAVYFLYHTLPTRIGALAPKKRRPQTTLVVARKTGSVPV